MQKSSTEATLSVNGIEFVWQADESLLIVSPVNRRYCRVEHADAHDLLDWLRERLNERHPA